MSVDDNKSDYAEGRERFQGAVRSRWEEINADTKEARQAVDAALNRLRDKGYDRRFCRSVLEGTLHYSPACMRLTWPPDNGG